MGLLYFLQIDYIQYYQALTLKEHPTVNLALPPVGLHKMVLHLLNN